MTDIFIDLFKDVNWDQYRSRDNGILAQKSCNFKIPDLYKHYKTDNLDLRNHIDSVIDSYNYSRKYTDFLGLSIDSHYEVEKLGISQYCKNNTVIFSLDDCFEFIFSIFCNSVITSQKEKSWYKDYHSYFFDCSNLNGKVKLQDLVDINPRLTWRIFNLMNKDRSAFTLNFIREIHSIADSIIDYIVYYLRTYKKEIFSGCSNECLAQRSKNLVSTIFTVDDTIIDNLPNNIVLHTTVGDNNDNVSDLYFNVSVNKFKPMEYLDFLEKGGNI